MKHVPTFYEFINEKNEPFSQQNDPENQHEAEEYFNRLRRSDWEEYFKEFSKEELIEIDNIIKDMINSPEQGGTSNH